MIQLARRQGYESVEAEPGKKNMSWGLRGRGLLVPTMIILALVGSLGLVQVVTKSHAQADESVLENEMLVDSSKAIVPGLDKLARGYNLFEGKWFATNLARYIGDFTPNDNSPVPLENIEYRKVYQVAVTLTSQCQLESKAQSAWRVSGQSDMKAKGKSLKFGLEDKATVTAEIPIPPASVGVEKEIRMAALMGLSDGMMESKSMAKRGYNFRTDDKYLSRAYTAQVLWGTSTSQGSLKPVVFRSQFISAMKDLAVYSDAAKRNQKVFLFFDKFGSHVISRAILGAYCKRSMFVQMQSSSNAIQTDKTNNGGVDLQLFGFQVGAGWKSRHQQTKHESNGAKVFVSQVMCGGTLQNNKCDKNEGAKSTDPVLVSSEGKPIWEIYVPGVGDASRQAMIAAVSDYISAARTCAQNVCRSRGVCVLATSFWNKIQAFDGKFSQAMFGTECICQDSYARMKKSGPNNCANLDFGDTVMSGKQLVGRDSTGGVNDYLESPNGRFKATMKDDGNFVLYDAQYGNVMFETSTSGQCGATCRLEVSLKSCSLRIVKNGGITIWSRDYDRFVNLRGQCKWVLDDHGNLKMVSSLDGSFRFSIFGTQAGKVSELKEGQSLVGSNQYGEVRDFIVSSDGTRALQILENGNVILFEIGPNVNSWTVKWKATSAPGGAKPDVTLRVGSNRCWLEVYSRARLVWSGSSESKRRGLYGCNLNFDESGNIQLQSKIDGMVWWRRPNKNCMSGQAGRWSPWTDQTHAPQCPGGSTSCRATELCSQFNGRSCGTDCTAEACHSTEVYTWCTWKYKCHCICGKHVCF